MYFETKDGKMYYEIIGEGKPVLFLHGWGQSLNTFKKVSEILKDDFQIILLDFLGFGMSDSLEEVISLNNYVTHIESFIKFLKIQSPIIVGHSFGGRVAIKYTAMNRVDKLILVDSAGIREKKLKKTIKIYKYKLLKRLYYIFSKEKYFELTKNSGSQDFRKASPVMKGVLIKVVNEDLKKYLKLINVKTLIIWGIFDKETIFSHGQIMNKYIKNSKLISFYNSGHFPYIDEEQKFIREVKEFLKG